jgi:hypothetical protein
VSDSPPGTSQFASGDRVRMNELGRRRHPKYGERQAVVIAASSPNSYRMRFDGRLSDVTAHASYLEKVESLTAVESAE